MESDDLINGAPGVLKAASALHPNVQNYHFPFISSLRRSWELKDVQEPEGKS